MPGSITIRPYQLSDAEALVEAARESTREIFPWLPWCHPEFSRKDAEEFLRAQVEAWASRREFEFCVVNADGRLVGGCALNQIHWGHRFGNVGYWVRTSDTGRGIATEAARQVIEFARAETDLVRLEIVAAVGNHASARVARKVGATLEGILRARLFLHGVPHDALMFSIVLDRP